MRKILTVIVVSMCALAACHRHHTVVGNGRIVTQTRNLPNFNTVEIFGHFKVNIEQAKQPKLSITADSNISPYIVTRIKQGALQILVTDKKELQPSQIVQITIDATKLDGLLLHGTNAVTTTDLKTQEFELDAKGMNALNVSLSAQKIKVLSSGDNKLVMPKISSEQFTLNTSGVAAISLAGSTKELAVSMLGSGQLAASDLASQQVVIKLIGSSQAQVYPLQRLEATVIGSGEVVYRGSPASVKKIIHGAGVVIQQSTHAVQQKVAK